MFRRIAVSSKRQTVWSWKWRHYNPSKRWKLLARHSVTSHNTWIFTSVISGEKINTSLWCVSNHHIQSVPHKTGSLSRQNHERILFRLVFGQLNAHCCRRWWKWDPCESINFCVPVIKKPFLISPCKGAGFKWNILSHATSITDRNWMYSSL